MEKRSIFSLPDWLKPDQYKKDKVDVSRRKILKGIGAVAATAVVGKLGSEVLDAVDEQNQRKIEEARRRAVEASKEKDPYEPIEPHDFLIATRIICVQ